LAIYVIGSAAALDLNVFVLVVQAFAKVPALKSAGSDTERAAIFGRAIARSADFRDPYGF
jgi:hypothetical protein